MTKFYPKNPLSEKAFKLKMGYQHNNAYFSITLITNMVINIIKKVLKLYLGRKKDIQNSNIYQQIQHLKIYIKFIKPLLPDGGK